MLFIEKTFETLKTILLLTIILISSCFFREFPHFGINNVFFF